MNEQGSVKLICEIIETMKRDYKWAYYKTYILKEGDKHAAPLVYETLEERKARLEGLEAKPLKNAYALACKKLNDIKEGKEVDRYVIMQSTWAEVEQNLQQCITQSLFIITNPEKVIETWREEVLEDIGRKKKVRYSSYLGGGINHG